MLLLVHTPVGYVTTNLSSVGISRDIRVVVGHTIHSRLWGLSLFVCSQVKVEGSRHSTTGNLSLLLLVKLTTTVATEEETDHGYKERDNHTGDNDGRAQKGGN